MDLCLHSYVFMVYDTRVFLCALAKFRKATIGFVVYVRLPTILSVRPSVHPYGTTGLSLDGFS